MEGRVRSENLNEQLSLRVLTEGHVPVIRNISLARIEEGLVHIRMVIAAAVLSTPIMLSGATADAAALVGDAAVYDIGFVGSGPSQRLSGQFSYDVLLDVADADDTLPPFLPPAARPVAVYQDAGDIVIDEYAGSQWVGEIGVSGGSTYAVSNDDLLLGGLVNASGPVDGLSIIARLEEQGAGASRVMNIDALLAGDETLFDSRDLAEFPGVSAFALNSTATIGIFDKSGTELTEFEATVVPLPAGVVLLATGVAGLGLARRWQQR